MIDTWAYHGWHTLTVSAADLGVGTFTVWYVPTGTTISSLPVITTQDQTVTAGASIQGSSLIASVSDGHNYPITFYSFWDEGTGGGTLALNGVRQTAGQWITVSAADVSQVTYVGGTAAGSEKVDVTVYDGAKWSDYKQATVTTTTSVNTTDDYPASIATTGRVAVGGSVTGMIGAAGDEDWFAANLTFGTTYTIRLQGQGHDAGTLYDPNVGGIHLYSTVPWNGCLPASRPTTTARRRRNNAATIAGHFYGHHHRHLLHCRARATPAPPGRYACPSATAPSSRRCIQSSAPSPTSMAG